MASTILSNIIEPTMFSAYVAQQTVAKSALIQSGVLARSDNFNVLAAGGGSVSHLPFFNPFTWTEADVASDDPTAKSTPSNLTTGDMIARKDYLSKSWSAMELAERVSGEDIVNQIGNGVANYWVQDLQKRALGQLASIALDNSDMVNTVGTDSSTNATNPEAATKASFGAIADAKQTMGDHANTLSMIVMHSVVYNNLYKSEPTSFVAPSTVQPFTTYGGLRVIVDDGVTVTQGTNRKMYNTFLLAPNAFAYGEATLPEGTEVWRDPAAGNGYGEERLYSRKQQILLPIGFAANPTITSRSKSPTIAQWSATGAFTRVYDRKLVPIAILQSNG